MIYFLQPIWGWAAAGIVIPIAIHLWNIKRGRTLKVGSIVFVTESVRSRSRNLKIAQWVLLLLRCFLIMLLSMLLAQPYINEQLNEKEQGWIVVEKTGMKKAYQAYQPIIDSLQKRGYMLHYFEETFPPADWKDTLKVKDDRGRSRKLSYWALLKALDEKLPANMLVYLFTDDRLQHFSGNRPEVSLQLSWYTYPSAGSETTWLAKAYKTTSDSIRAVIGKSSSVGTYYTYQNLSFDNADDKYLVNTNNGKVVVSTKDSLHQSVIVDTTPLFVTIYTSKYSADANYLKAALNAITNFTQHDIRVTLVTSKENIPNIPDWLFWLSDEALPASKMAKKVFVYEHGKSENIYTVLLAEDNKVLTVDEPIVLYKYIKSNLSAFQPIWKNSYDEPVLSSQKDRVTVYHFYSRFNPQWNDLVWSPLFPQIMYNLLFGSEEVDGQLAINDKRILDSSQIQSTTLSVQNRSNKELQLNKKDVSQVLWIVTFLLLALERIISFKQAKGAYE